ncbi:hypothetical protein TrVE_jg6943 [Triparma verrucosa]|uniref:Uncharacterized protein n=1 Tax=Triparma verrucosa TaxID=1606542 RepID=A0A9W7BDI3_9STRA|nr:hypothetical protein TrVE_jg6943 [Triparma verrucosa]
MRTLQRVGIYGFVLSLGLSLILDFKFPGGAKLNWGYQMLHMFFSVMFNISINWGASKVKPIIVSLGTIMGVPLVPVLSCLLCSACEDLGVKGLVGIGMLSFTVGVVWRTRKTEDRKKISLEESQIAEEEHKSLV